MMINEIINKTLVWAETNPELVYGAVGIFFVVAIIYILAKSSISVPDSSANILSLDPDSAASDIKEELPPQNREPVPVVIPVRIAIETSTTDNDAKILEPENDDNDDTDPVVDDLDSPSRLASEIQNNIKKYVNDDDFFS